MTVINYGKDHDYAYSRLGNTYVLAKNRWTFVQGVKLDMSLVGIDVLTGKEVTVPMKDVLIAPPKLGWMNYKRTIGYVARKPARHYKQGISIGKNVFVKLHDGNPWAPKEKFCTGLAKCAMGIYPSMISAAEQVENGEVDSRAFCHSLALSKKTALQKGFELLHRGRDIGTCTQTMDGKGLNFAIKPEFMFLEQVVGEEIDAQQ